MTNSYTNTHMRLHSFNGSQSTYTKWCSRSIVLALCVSLAPKAYAQSNEWTASDGAWTEATNWSLGHIPEWQEIAFLPGTIPYRVGVETNVDFSNLWITNPNAELVIAAGAKPSLYGNLYNFGTILFNPSAADETTSLLFTADTIISGTGIIRLNAIEDYRNATLGQRYNSYRIINGKGHTIAGSGAIYGKLTNHGTIIADGPVGEELRIGGVNADTIIQSETSLIYAKTGDIHFVDDVITIHGGTLRSDPPARILPDRAIHLIGVNNEANIVIDGLNQSLSIEGDTTNNSIIQLIRGWWFYPPSILIPHDTILSGSGEILIDNPARILVDSGATLTNAQGHTISGLGYIDIAPDASFVNQGALIAGPGEETLTITGHIQGTGSFRALDEAVLALVAGDDAPYSINDINLSTQGTGEIRLLGGIKLNNLTNEANLTVSGDGLNPSLGGEIINNASLQIYKTTIVSPDTIFSGSGITKISVYGSNTLSPAPGSAITIEADHHFEVGSTLNGPVINLGTINVTGQVYGPVVNHNTVSGMGTIYGPFENNGIVRQAGISPLKVSGDHTQGTGSYNAGPLGIEFADCQLAHTTINSDGGGLARFGGSHFDSIVNNAHMFSYSQAESVFTGLFVNNNTLTLLGPFNRSIRFPESITIQGPGTIEMIGAQSNTSPRLVVEPGATLTINPAHTIRGHGLLKGNTLNEGTIDISSEPFEYTAAMHVEDLTLSPSSVVRLDLADGFTTPEKLIILENGSLTLGGTLEVRFSIDTPPTLGQWTIIDGDPSSNLISEFDEINFPFTPANRSWNIEQTPTSLTVTLTCRSDLNTDFEFNFYDISAFITAYTGQTDMGDFNNDGEHNFLDISAFINAFNTPCQ